MKTILLIIGATMVLVMIFGSPSSKENDPPPIDPQANKRIAALNAETARLRSIRKQLEAQTAKMSHAPILGIDADTAAAMGVAGKTIDVLKDPRSLQVVDLYTKTTTDTAIGCMEFRSRNGFGGFVGGHATWRMKGNNLMFAADDASLWNSWCTGGGFSSQKALIAGVERMASGS